MPKSKVATFNYLHRFKIPIAAIDIEARLNGKSEPVAIVKRLDLPSADDTAHDAETWRKAAVLVEPWRSSSANWARHSLGTVGDLSKKLKSPVTLPLPGFPAADGITYRVKVVASDTSQLLAEAERIRPSNEEDKPGAVDELIPVRTDVTLGEEPWRIDWTDEEVGPVVKVSNKLTDPETFFTRDPAFVAAMMPQIMREVLFRLALDGELRSCDWTKKWFEFAARFDDRDPPPPGQWRDAQTWADDVVQAFCKQHQFVSDANKFFNSESAAP